MGKYEMSKPDTLSIAMCTYNGERFLQEQLDSFLSQTRLPDELVVCDDGSQDDTIAILKAFSQEAPFSVIIHQNEKNLGYGKNFEKVASLSSKDIILFSDQDDIWLPDKLEKISVVFSNNPGVGLVFSDASMVDDNLHDLGYSLWDVSAINNKDLKIYLPEHFTPYFFKRPFIVGCTTALKTDICRILLPLPDHWTHDQWLPFGASILSKVASLPVKLIKYRQHISQFSGQKKLEFFERFIFHYNKSNIIKMLYFFENQLLWIEGYLRIASDNKLYNDNILRAIEAYLQFENIRYNPSLSKIERLINIFKEYRSGNYHIFTSGTIAFLKDIIFY
jgi:glycosyltransferase involved in cell wall biosynthesis